MTRFFRGLNLGFISLILVIGFLFNSIVFFRNQEEYPEDQKTEEEKPEVEEVGRDDWLKMPAFSNEDPLLLGKSSSKKVKLAFGMVLVGDAKGKSYFTEVIHEIIRQDPKPDGSRSLVIVLLLIENRRSKMEQILEALKHDLAKEMLNGYVQLVISPFDSNVELFKAMKDKSNFDDVPDITAKMTLRLSFLISYCHDIAKNLMFIDNDKKPIPEALNIIYNQIDTIPPRTVEINFGETMDGRLLTGKYMLRMSAALYSVAFLGSLGRIHRSLWSSLVNETKISYEEKKIFKTIKSKVLNPPAEIKTTFHEVGGKLPNDAYLSNDISWFDIPKNGDTFTMELKKPEMLQRIAIDTGMSSFGRDCLSWAFLEISHEKSKDTNQCINYKTAQSFEETASVEVLFDEKEDAVLLLKPIHCIRIRVTRDHGQWCAIKSIAIVPR